MVNSEELIGATEYLTLYTTCGINRCRYNRVQLHFGFERGSQTVPAVPDGDADLVLISCRLLAF
jgi:hypothetical protein